MKIRVLDIHCGNCSVIDFCGEAYDDLRICTDYRFSDMTEEEYLELAEKSSKGFKEEIADDVYRKIKEAERTVACTHCK